MSEFSFENQGNNTYLVYEVLDERKIDQLALGMLSNNTIENLAAMVYTQQNLRRYIKYNVTAKISVQDILNGMIDRRHLTNMLYGILSAVSDAEEYMLDINTLLFEFDKIFVDVSTGSTVMICLPIVGENRKMPDLKMFFKELLFSAQLNPNEQNDYFVSIINYLNGASIFSVNEFKQLLSGIMNGSKVADTKNVEQKAVRTEKPRAKEARTTVMPQMPKSTVSTPQTSVPHTPQRPNVPSVPNVPNIPNIPNVPNIPNAPIPQGMQGNRSGEQSEEKEISWFYLMQHYNKENAALYKMQKEMKKGQDKKEDSKEAKKGAKKESKKEKKEKKDKKGKTAAVPQGGAFAVPGGMAVPNMPAKDTQIPIAAMQTPSQPDVYSEPVSGLYTRAVPEEFSHGRANFGETTVLSSGGGMGETTVLSAAMLQEQTQPKPYLLRLKNNEKILLNKPVFRIGKEKSYVDYFISDNTAISRSHANIIVRDDGCFVVDTNSTNHTYVEERMIQSNEEVKLQDGMKIRLANEEFEFRIM